MSQPAASTQTRHPRRWLILAALWLCVLVIGFDVTILNVALPTLAAELDASTSQLQWIVDAYLLVLAALLLAAGTVGDRVGRKRLLLVGLAAFAGASILAAASPSPGYLIAARALMGVGAAIIMPLTLAVLPTVFAPEERPKAIAAWAAGAGIGLPLGPILGGLLLEHFWWGSVFLINVPLVAIALLAGAVLLPESRDATARRPDLLGMALSCAGSVVLVYAIVEAGRVGWTDTAVLAAFAGAVVLLGGFGWWQRSAAAPLIELGWFSDVRFFAWATFATALAGFGLIGVLFVVPQYLQTVRGYSTIDTGLGLLPLMPGLVVGAAASARATAKLGTRLPVTCGLLVMAAGLLLHSAVSVDSGFALLAGALAVVGLGTGLALAPALDAILAVLPDERFGVGTGLSLTVRMLGGALGVAVLGSILSSAYATRLTTVLDGLSGPARQAAEGSLTAALELADRMPDGRGQELAATARQAFVDGMGVVMLTAAAITVVGALLVGSFLTRRPRQAESTVPIQEPQWGTFIFADLAGYTALTEVHGDERAADIAQAFCARVCAVEKAHGAKDVKTIGDAVMARATDAGEAILLGLKLCEEIGRQAGFPAVRVGMHRGPAVQRGDDWFGATVNVAARIAELAGPHEVLLTEATVSASGPLEGVTLIDLGPRPLRNISEPVRVLRAARTDARPTLPVDPICQMTVDPDTAPAALRTEHGVEWFCSAGCLRRFKSYPDRNASPPSE